MKPFLALCLLLTIGLANADTKYFGIFLKGARVGYVSRDVRPDSFQGKPATREESHWAIALYKGARMTVDEACWSDAQGRPMRYRFSRTGAGPSQAFDAVFGERTAEVDRTDAGVKIHKSVPMPDGAVVAEPSLWMLERMPAGEGTPPFVLNEDSLKFEKAEFKTVGPSSTTVGKVSVSANLVQMTVAGTTVRGFYDPQGAIVQLETGGMHLLPEPKEEALTIVGKDAPTQSLDDTLAIKADGSIAGADNYKELKFRVTDADLSRTPSDAGQTVTKDGDGWIVEIHPTQTYISTGADVDQPAFSAEIAKWTQPGNLIASDNPEITKVAHKLTANSRNVRESVLIIKNYVYKIMRPNPKKAELRDGADLLKSPQGMCGNYAVLTTTLLRAAGIPARMASGLMTWDGTFYYHAWCEAWDGGEWLGVDSTVQEQQFSPGHLKLTEGTVEDAQKLGYLGTPHIKVLATIR